MKPHRSLLIILTLLVTNLCAQTPGPSPKQKGPLFRTLGLGVNLEGLYYMDGKKDVPVQVTQNTRSEFFSLPSASPLEFYRIEKAADGSVVRIPVARAAVPEGSKLLLLVFSEGASKNTIIETLDDSLAAFPGGSYRVLNRLNQPLDAVMMGQKTLVPAHGTALINVRGPGSTRFVQISLAGTTPPRTILSNNWSYSEELRTLVIAAPSVPPSDTPLVARISEPVYLAQSPEVPSTAPKAP